MSYQVAEALRSGDLVSLLEDVEDKKLPIQVVSVEGRKNLTKVKMFIDYVKAGLTNNEYLNPRAWIIQSILAYACGAQAAA